MKPFQNITPSAGETVYGSIAFEEHLIPLVIASGPTDGPVLAVIGMQHATEYSGPGALDRVLETLDPSRLSGTLVCLPFVNPLQLYLTPEEFKEQWNRPEGNLNRQWPGDAASDNPLSRLARLIWDKVLTRSDAVIDMHCCRTVDPRFTACLEGHAASEDLAVAMRLDAVDLQTAASYAEGTLKVASSQQLDIAAVLVESHPAQFQVREAVDACAASLMRAMVHLRMLPSWTPPPPLETPNPIFSRSQSGHALEAGNAGYLGVRRWSGEAVAEGQAVAVVRSLQTFDVVEELASPVDGAVGSCGPADSQALVEPGTVVATVKAARFP